MLGKLGLHVIKFPSGRFGFVGSIPTELGTEVPATTSDVTGGRAHHNAAGELVAWKFPVFDTAQAAADHAASKGFSVAPDGAMKESS